MSGCYQPVPNVGITWMAGWIGPILAVRLLGRASIYLMAPASQAFQLAWTNRTTGLPSGQDGSFRASSRQRHPAPGGSPCPSGNVKSVAPRRKGRPSWPDAVVPSRCARLFAALAGLVVRAYATRLRNGQYMLVNGVIASLSRAVCPLNGLGSRGLDPMFLGGHHGAADVPAIAVAAAPYRLALPVRPRPGSDDAVSVTGHPNHPNRWSGRVGRVYSPHPECNLIDSVSYRS
jgi:hypothetical protein